MHELSLALEVIDMAQRETTKNSLTSVLEILIEVGVLSGVEADAFEMAMKMASKDSILEGASINIVRIPGKGRCVDCRQDFPMENPLATCPECHGLPDEIIRGREFRVVSLVAE